MSLIARIGFATASTPLMLCAFSAPPLAAQAGFETTRIANGVFQFRAETHNAFFVSTRAGVVAFDPISNDAAARYSDAIRRSAPGQPLAAIVYSHSDADHATGATVLQDEFGDHVPIIAHENAVPILVEGGDADLPPPDLTFSDDMTLRFGGRAIELHYLGPSHSDNMLVAYLPDERVAFAVDFVSNDRVGFRDLPGWHFADFYVALERLMEIPFETVVFGHGDAGNRATIERQLAYYSDLKRAVEEAVERGWSEAEAMERVQLDSYAGWDQYDEWFPLNVGAVYRWVTSR